MIGLKRQRCTHVGIEVTPWICQSTTASVCTGGRFRILYNDWLNLTTALQALWNRILTLDLSIRHCECRYDTKGGCCKMDDWTYWRHCTHVGTGFLLPLRVSVGHRGITFYKIEWLNNIVSTFKQKSSTWICTSTAAPACLVWRDRILQSCMIELDDSIARKLELNPSLGLFFQCEYLSGKKIHVMCYWIIGKNDKQGNISYVEIFQCAFILFCI